MSTLKLKWIGYLAICAASLAWMLFRIRFGVDFTDESYYIALPWSYELGAKPFVDEILPHHTMGLLLWPFLKLFLFFTKSMDGVVLYFRHLYVLTSALISILIFHQLKRLQPPKIAFLYALSVFLYVPFAIPALSYNSISILFSILSLCLSLNTSKSAQITSGLTAAIAIFSYPTLLVPFLFWFAIRASLNNIAKQKYFIIGFLATSFIFGLIVTYFGIDNFINSFRAAKLLNVQKTGWEKITEIANSLWSSTKLKLLLIPLGIVFFKNKKITTLLVSLILFTGSLEVFRKYNDITNSLFLSYFFLFFSGFVIFGNYFYFHARKYFEIYAFSLIGGLAMAYTSANGIFNSSLMAPLALLAVSITYAECESSLFKNAASITLSALCCYCIISWGQYTYRDERPFTVLTTEIHEGAFKGLRTSTEKATFISNIRTNLQKHVSSKAQSILFIDEFPAGYLLTSLKPNARSIWTMPASDYQIDRNIYLSKYTSTSELPDIIYQIDVMFFTKDYSRKYVDNEPVRNFFKNNNSYSKIDLSESQSIFIKSSTQTQ